MHDFSRWLRVRAANEFKTAKRMKLERVSFAFKSLLNRCQTVYLRYNNECELHHAGGTCCSEQFDLFRRIHKRTQMALPFLYRACTTQTSRVATGQERMRYIVKLASANAQLDVTQEGGVKNVRTK